jgi:hypothetical protein
MKSLFILLFFLIITWITYNYSYNKFYSEKIKKEIKYVLLPLTIDDQFKYGKLDKSIFRQNNITKNYSLF